MTDIAATTPDTEDDTTAPDDKLDATNGPPDVIELVPGLPLQELARQMAEFNRMADVGFRGLAFSLHDFQRRQLFNVTGHQSAVHYAVATLNKSEWQADQLLKTGGFLHELPLIDAAFAAGQIDWSKVRLLAPIATMATEREWLEHTKGMTYRQLELAVKGAERGRSPREDRIELAKVTFNVHGKLKLLAHEKWELAKQKIASERGQPVTNGQLMEILADLVLSTRDDGTIPGREPIDDSLYRIVIREGAAHSEAELLTKDGPLPIDRGTAAAIACDARHESDGDGKVDQAMPDWLRKRVRIRDGLKCTCCGSRHQLMVHHLVPRAAKGPHKSENCATVCMPCHARVHSNLLFIEGTPSTGLRFLNREGRSIDKPEVAPDVLQVRMQPRAVVPDQGSHAPLAMTFATLPGSMDVVEWRRHAHLFSWNDRRGTLEFREGLPVDVADVAPSPAQSTPLRTLVGQERVIQNLTIAVTAAQMRGSVLPHVLLSGAPGLGKTTIAEALATEMHAPLRTVSGQMLKEPSGLVQALVSLDDKAILFIDETQSLPRAVAETLYEALANGKLSLHVSSGTRSKMVEIRLAPFTVIGATTDEGMLPAPLRGRFPIRERFEPYSTDQLRHLLCQAAIGLGTAIDVDAADLLASVSRGTPREALGHLLRARDQAQVAGTRIDISAAERTLHQQGIDLQGLGRVDREYLACLPPGRTLSLKQLARHLGVAEQTLAEVHEPWLVRQGLIAVTPHGRVALHPRR